MQSNFWASSTLMKTSSQQIASPRKDPFGRSNSRKVVIVIDLSDCDEVGLTHDHNVSHQNAFFDRGGFNSNHSIAQSNILRKESKRICDTFDRSALSKNGRKDTGNGNQLMALETILPQIYDVDGSETKSTVNSHEHLFRLQKMTVYSPNNQFPAQKNEKQTNKSSNPFSINNLFQSLVIQKPLHFEGSGLIYSGEEPSLKKMDTISNSFDVQAKQGRRRTRNRPRKEGQLYEEPEGVDFMDEDVKTYFKAAKYRYGISECSTVIDKMVVSVSNRIHFGQSYANVQAYPTIPQHTDKHRILIQCYRLQFKRRKFIYLD